LYALMQLFFHASPLLLYLLVVVTLLLESSGVPIVNTTLLLFTGALASLGHLDIRILIAAAIFGSTAGACLAYMIGLQGGRRIYLRLLSVLHIEEQKVNVVERWFQQSGAWMIFLSRMTPYVRPFACFPAGISRMPRSRFFTAALAGSATWCVVILYVGLALGRRWRFALHLIQDYTLPTLCALALVIALYVLVTYGLRCYLQEAPDSVNSEDEQGRRDLLEV
jgi:membrane protein DedA with SNARE-associated domain